jgi:muramoyltetrapeptide carboxypeptidase
MKPVKPQRLRPGDVIGVFAPSSPAADDAKVERGVRYLEKIGYRVEVGKSVYKRHGYLAGMDGERAADIHTFFRKKSVRALFATRGGYGIHRILPLIDYPLIRKNPKIVVGYSDVTALHCALLSRSGLVSFSGAMVASAMSDGSFGGRTEERFWQMLTSADPPDPVRPADRELYSGNLRAGKETAGTLIGGNLSLLAALAGTPYLPPFTNRILLLEDIGERPYRIDRMLQQLKLAGLFRNLRGILLGDFRECQEEKGKPSLTLPRVFQETFAPLPCPVLSGFHYGHVRDSITFPFGVRASLRASKKRLEFLESGVS